MFIRSNKDSSKDGVNYMDLSPSTKDKKKGKKKDKKQRKKKLKQEMTSGLSIYDDVLDLIRNSEVVEPILDLPEFLMNDCGLGQSTDNIEPEFSSAIMEHTKHIESLSDISETFSKQIEETNEEIDDILSEIDEEPLDTPVEINSIHDILENDEPEEPIVIESVDDITDSVIEEIGEAILNDIVEEPLTKGEPVEPLTTEEPVEPLTEEVATDELDSSVDVTDINNLIEEIENVDIKGDMKVKDAVEPLNVEETESVEPPKETLTPEDEETLKNLLNIKDIEEDKSEPIDLNKEPITPEPLSKPSGMMLDMSDVVTSSIKEEV